MPNRIYNDAAPTDPLRSYYYASDPTVKYWENNPGYSPNLEGVLSMPVFSSQRLGFVRSRLGTADSYSSNSAATSDQGTPYNFAEYLEGLFSSVGAENQANRLYNSAEAQAQREWSSAEAALNRSWQENMSNTAYSRAVNDLKQAGLNPILAAGGMSSTPTGAVLAGSTASYQTGGGDRASDILNALANSASAVSDVLTFFLPKLSKLLK